METLKSEIDNSINYVYDAGKGKFESRYVNRENGYAICYLSSHNGCNRGCRFCHLTATKQTSFQQATIPDYRRQMLYVLDNLDINKKNHVHFNFMARGEPMLNDHVLSGEVFSLIDELSIDYNFTYENLVSTIMPELGLPIAHYFEGPIIYYSWYSNSESFRKKWLPTAGNPDRAFDLLDGYYLDTGIESKIHFALIKGENDSKENIEKLLEKIDGMYFKPKVNLVRYNSPDDSEESDKYDEICDMINNVTECKIIPRVGFDVKASCGMFVG